MRWHIETEVGQVEADGLVGGLFDTTPGADVSATVEFIGADALDRHQALQPLVDAALEGETIRIGSRAGRPYYRERLEAFEGVDSLLVRLDPIADARGSVWAVLRGGTDESPAVERSVYVWSLELTVLRRAEAGDERDGVEAEFTNEVV